MKKDKKKKAPAPAFEGRNKHKPADFKGSMGKLIRFIKPYYPMLLISLLFAACASVCNIIAPGLLKDLTNEVYKGTGLDMSVVASKGGVLIALYGSNALLNYVQSYMMTVATHGITKRFRTSISLKINRLPLKFFDGKAHGDTLSRVTNDVDTIGVTLEESLASMLQSIVLVVGILIAMFITKWQLALAAVATVPISAIFMMALIKKTQPMWSRQQKILGELNGQIEESYSGQNIIKIFNAAEEKQAEFDEINTRLYNNTWKAQFFSGLMMPINTLVSNLGYVAVCVVGAILYKSDPENMAGVIISFFVYVRLFRNPINTLGQIMNELQSTAAAAERVFEFLEETEQQDTTWSGISPTHQ